jgi:stage II sporulation protein D
VSPRRQAVALALALALAAPAGAASGAEAPRVRVCLAEGARPLHLAGAGGAHVVRPTRGGLALDGHRVGRSWRVAGAPFVTLEGRRYRGSVRVLRTPGGVAAVNEVALEDYVASVVASETWSSFGSAALRAQAVAARSYVLHQQRLHAGDAWDLEAGTASQAYGGADAETTASRAAAEATRGQVLLYQGEPILAAFHATAGGVTASAEEVWGRPVPYLQSQPVEGEDLSPDTYWRIRVSTDELARALRTLGIDVGSVREVGVVERSPSGRAARLRVAGSRGSRELEGRRLREALGEDRLRSTAFQVRSDGDGFVFAGTGRGHGVGMSQWGAEAMGEQGASYRAILAHFYPGTRLAIWSEEGKGMASAHGDVLVGEAAQ